MFLHFPTQIPSIMILSSGNKFHFQVLANFQFCCMFLGQRLTATATATAREMKPNKIQLKKL